MSTDWLTRTIVAYVDAISSPKSRGSLSARTVVQAKPGVKISVSQRYSSDTYQRLYQKGFRAGRRYERGQHEEVLEINELELYDAQDRTSRMLEANHEASLEISLKKHELRRTRWLFAGMLLGDLIVVYLAGRFG